MSNEDDEFLRMAEECGISKYKHAAFQDTPEFFSYCAYEAELIALCKKV